jgi:hypothetical protein
MMTLLKVLKNNGGGGNAPTPLFCASLHGCGNRVAWLPFGVTDGASYRRATPDREPASRCVLARCEILDGFGGQRLATDAPFAARDF